MARMLVLVAYDVTEPCRLTAAREAVTGWAAGGQKSVFECLVTYPDRPKLTREMLAPLALREDRLALFAVSSRDAQCLGAGMVAQDEPVVWIG